METSHSNFIDCGSHKFNKLHKCVFRSISYYSAVFPRILHYSPLYTLFSTILTVLYYSLLFFSIPYYSPLYTLFSTIVTIIIVLQHSPLFSIIIHYIHFPKKSQYSQLFFTISTILTIVIIILNYSLLFRSIFHYIHYFQLLSLFFTISYYFQVFQSILTQFSIIMTILHSNIVIILHSSTPCLSILQYSLLFPSIHSTLYTILKDYHYSQLFASIFYYIHYSQVL